MADVQVPTIAIGTPAVGDSVLGVVSGAVRRLTSVTPMIGNIAVIEDYAGATTLIKMQAALNSGRPIVRGTKGASYDLNGGTLVIKSNTTLDLTGCTITTPSTTNPMVKNENALIAGRDSNIAIIGGDWTAGAVDGNTHRFLFNKVDGLVVTPRSITSTSGKYAVSLSDVTLFEVGNIIVASASDGVHVTGPASNGWIHDISGNSHDDFVALGCADYAAYDYSKGTIDGVVVERIRPVQSGSVSGVSGVNLFINPNSGNVTSPGDMKNITVRDVSGTVSGAGVSLFDAFALGGIFDNILVDGVSVTNLNAGYAQARLYYTGSFSGTKYGRITFRNIAPASAMASVVHYGVQVDTTANARTLNLTVDGLKLEDAAGASMQGVRVTGGPVDALVVRNPHGSLVNASTRTISVSGAATVKQLAVKDCALTGSTLLYVGDTSAVNFLDVSGLHDTPANGAAITHTASTLLVANFAGFRLITGDFVSIQNASASMEFTGIAENTAGNGLFKTAAQNVYCRSFGIRLAVDRITKRDGDMAYNLNAGLACGKGPVYCNGTVWTHVTSGATY
jgi:hypothetical protein